jgi:hypothetical protein
MPAVLTVQQERVRAVQELFEEFCAPEVPSGGQAGSWLRTWADDAALLRTLRTLGEQGTLSIGLPYTSKCLATALRRGKRPDRKAAGESDRVLAEARDRQGRMG